MPPLLSILTTTKYDKTFIIRKNLQIIHLILTGKHDIFFLFIVQNNIIYVLIETLHFHDNNNNLFFIVVHMLTRELCKHRHIPFNVVSWTMKITSFVFYGLSVLW